MDRLWLTSAEFGTDAVKIVEGCTRDGGGANVYGFVKHNSQHLPISFMAVVDFDIIDIHTQLQPHTAPRCLFGDE